MKQRSEEEKLVESPIDGPFYINQIAAVLKKTAIDDISYMEGGESWNAPIVNSKDGLSTEC